MTSNNETSRALNMNYCKIVSSTGGHLHVNEENLAKLIAEGRRESEFPDDIPVAILSIVGAPGSGKTLFTNFLIHYYEGQGGGWLEDLTNADKWGQKKKLKGFIWNSVKEYPGIFKPSEKDLATSGVYVWPKPFLVRTPWDDPLLVWIFHLCRAQCNPDEVEDTTELEMFLLLVSSRMSEFHFGDGEPSRLLKCANHLYCNSNFREAATRSNVNICDSVVIVFSSSSLEPRTMHAVTNDEAKKEFNQLAKNSTDPELRKNASIVVNCFKHFNVLQMLKFATSITDQEGCLNTSDGEFNKIFDSVKKVVSALADNEEVAPKKFSNGGTLTMTDFAHYVRSCINTVNFLNKRLATFSENMEVRETTENRCSHHLPEKRTGQVIPRSHDGLSENSVGAPIPSPDGAVNLPSKSQSTFDEDKKFVDYSTDTTFLPQQEDNLKKPSEKFESQSKTEEVRPTSTTKENPLGSSHHGLSENETQRKRSESNHIMNVDSNKCCKNENEEVCGETESSRHQQPARANESEAPLAEGAEEKSSLEEERKEKAEHKKIEREKVKKAKEEQEKKVREEQKRIKLEKQEHERQAKDKLKREREEAERKKLETTKHFAETAVIYLTSNIYPATLQWIRSKKPLKPNDISKIGDIYSQVLKTVQDHNLENVDQLLWKKIIEDRCYDICLEYLTTVMKRLRKYSDALKFRFSSQHCFDPTTLDNIAIEEYEKVNAEDAASTDEEIAELVREGCQNLLLYFFEGNTENIKEDQKLAESLFTKMADFYRNEMENFLTEDVYSPRKLKEVHSMLVQKLMSAFQSSFETGLGKGQVESIGHLVGPLEMLNQLFRSEFIIIEKKNNTSLKNLSSKLSKTSQKAKSSYVGKIEGVLDKNPYGLEVKELERKHNEFVNEAKDLLKTEIVHNIRKQEPLEPHLNVLQAYVDDYWKAVFETNSSNIKKNKLKKPEEEEENPKDMSKANHPLHERCEQPKPSTYAQVTTVSEQISQEKTTPFQDKRSLPPLVFQLLSSQIVMGMSIDGNEKILKNSSGEYSTPFIVGLTDEGNMIYGSEAVAHLTPQEAEEQSDVVSSPHLRKQWWIMKKILSAGAENKAETIHLSSGETHSITVEFLLGFLFRRLKQQVEICKTGTVSTAVITVPYWFCSTHRLFVKHGAKLAGFKEVFLVNEASAAAYGCSGNGTRSECIAILSESCGNVDATFYKYSSFSDRRYGTMIGHYGSYNLHAAEKAVGGSIPFFGGAINHVYKSFWGSVNPKNVVQNICKEALKMAKVSSDYPGVASWNYFSESDTWKRIFMEVIPQLHETCNAAERDSTVVMLGALALSGNAKEIPVRIRDNLAFSVIRSCSGKDSKIIHPKNSSLPQKRSTRLNFEIPQGKNEAYFRQNFVNSSVNVGKLVVSAPIKRGYQAVVQLQISNEALVSLDGVLIKDQYLNIGKQELSGDQFSWTSPNLTNEKYQMLDEILDSLQKQYQEESSEMSAARKALLQECQAIKEKLNSGTVFTFKSEVTKKLFDGKIEKSMEQAKDPNATLDDLQTQMENLKKWSSLYSSK